MSFSKEAKIALFYKVSGSCFCNYVCVNMEIVWKNKYLGAVVSLSTYLSFTPIGAFHCLRNNNNIIMHTNTHCSGPKLCFSML